MPLTAPARTSRAAASRCGGPLDVLVLRGLVYLLIWLGVITLSGCMLSTSLMLVAGGAPRDAVLGWLVFALLDRDVPRKDFSLPGDPVLGPDEPWELAGDVSNVVFTCDTAELGDGYLAYYGGADAPSPSLPSTCTTHSLLPLAAELVDLVR